MHRRSLMVALLVVIAAVGTVLYSMVRPVQEAIRPNASPTNRAVRKSAAQVPTVGPKRQSGYFENEYALLRQRERNGNLARWQRDLFEAKECADTS